LSKKTLEKVKETKNDAVVQVKNNQGYLLFDCKRNAKGKKGNDFHINTEKKRRNRIETRVTKTFHNPDFIYKEKWVDLIPMIVQVIRITEKFDTKDKIWKSSEEISYYISTKVFSAEQTAEIIRSHWGIENRNHYVRDTAMEEDASRIRKNPGIFVKLRSFALNIMRYNGAQNIKNEIYQNTLSFNKLKKYKGLFK